MKSLKKHVFWFIPGSQFLYGEETLRQVEENCRNIVDTLNLSGALPAPLILKPTVTTNQSFQDIVQEANYDDDCLGLVIWCHTFSPSKMWINGFNTLQKPFCHLHTQFGQTLPHESIDMDFMNLHQAAHADREHGYVLARMRLPHRLIVGHWNSDHVKEQLASWMGSAYGIAVSKNLKLVRFGDNMREVAVTEGDKVGAQIRFGWQVNTWATGDLVKEIEAVTDEEVDKQLEIYEEYYEIDTDDMDSVRYQARLELAMKRLFSEEDAGAFSNNFQDLYGMDQLPGLATQNLMREGYGYAGEGDWKTAALTHIMKQMEQAFEGKDDYLPGTTFIEDYTYDLTPEKELALGAHMLEVCPSIAITESKPKIQVHHLGIGDRNPPARLVFDARPGDARLLSLVDMGGRYRLICHEIEVVEAPYEFPKLPVARAIWKAKPDFHTGIAAWIKAGGAHHSTLTYNVSARQMKDFAEYFGIEFVHINEDTDLDALEKELILRDLAERS